MKEELIKCFQDTINQINANPLLLINTKKAMKNTKLYSSLLNEEISLKDYGNEHKAVISVVENTTFNAAKDLINDYKKVAVLNFASAVNPGGGVTIGAKAQEECLCRSSNLLPCLKQKNLIGDYYLFHRKYTDKLYSDKLIYTKNITVFKTDEAIPKMMQESDWFNVDIITCAAPNISKNSSINKDDSKIFWIFVNRIKCIFNAAVLNDVNALVLGAFGCGAFGNSPETVSKAFKYVIFHEKYITKFEKIVFAIKKSNKDNKNYQVFNKVFSAENAETNSNIPYDILKNNADINQFKKWQATNKFYGKYVSVFGDSISTLYGCIPNGHTAFYNAANSKVSGISKISDTWWGKVISFLGANLLVNNSWSGSRVTGNNNQSGCSDYRTGNLHRGNQQPDIILIYLGFNDWASGAKISGLNNNDSTNNNALENFEIAYSTMLSKLKVYYPKAQMYCFTISTTYMSTNEYFNFPFEKNKIRIKEYNRIIASVSKQAGCKLIDLYKYKISYDTLDGSHPNLEGMKTISKLVCCELLGDEALEFLDVDLQYIKRSNEAVLPDNSFEIKDELVQLYCCNCGAKLSKNSNFCLKCGIKKYCSNTELQIKCISCNNSIPKNAKYCPYCGETVINTADNNSLNEETAEQENIIDIRYKLIKEIGKGGSSRVYLANDERLDRQCAVKIVSKNGYANKIASQMLLEEANKMKFLHHVSIPQLYDVLDEENRLCIVMEYVEGTTLEKIIRNTDKALEEELVVGWAKQLCGVLDYLHSLNPPRIFRDVKPSNIILQPDGKIKLLDFGIMREYDENKDTDTCNLGTKGFAAPEQFTSVGQSDARTDIYALGMTIHYLLTGISPVKMESGIIPISKYRPELSPQLDYIVKKCTEKNPNDRYQCCNEVITDLEKLEFTKA